MQFPCRLPLGQIAQNGWTGEVLRIHMGGDPLSLIQLCGHDALVIGKIAPSDD
jgi:hypothetical protein